MSFCRGKIIGFASALFFHVHLHYPRHFVKIGCHHPSYLKPPDLSSSVPPGACRTRHPGEVIDNFTIIFLTFYFIFYPLSLFIYFKTSVCVDTKSCQKNRAIAGHATISGPMAKWNKKSWDSPATEISNKPKERKTQSSTGSCKEPIIAASLRVRASLLLAMGPAQ